MSTKISMLSIVTYHSKSIYVKMVPTVDTIGTHLLISKASLPVYHYRLLFLSYPIFIITFSLTSVVSVCLFLFNSISIHLFASLVLQR